MMVSYPSDGVTVKAFLIGPKPKGLNATVTYVKTVDGVDGNRIAVTGFCMGGSYALMLPCVNRDIKAAVPLYGQVPNPGAPHAFFNDTRKDVYKPAAAEDAWKRTLAFFGQHLKG